MRTHAASRRLRACIRLFGGAIGMLALTVTAPPATAQESAPRPAGYVTLDDDRGRLGVYLQLECGIETPSRDGCAAPPIVASLVEGAPAAEAGVQTGDTLLALNGVSLSSETGRRSLETLRAGEPVTLHIGRAAGRHELRVTPSARRTTGLFELSGPTWRSAAPSNVQVFRLRDEDGGVSEFHFSPSPESPERPGGAAGFVVFEADESGVFSMGFGRPDVQVFTRDGRQVELEELERRIREAGDQAAQEFGVARVFGRTPGGQGLEVEVEVAGPRSVEGQAPPRRLILENAPLAQRLETVHRQALAEARVRIDSILHVRGELRPLERVRAPAAPAPSTYRLAGAEFQSLTAELAEYFAVDTGVLVLRVIPQTPAARLGLRGGDVVVEVDGRATPDVVTFRAVIGEGLARGLEPSVKWNRKGKEFGGNLASR